MGIKTIISGIGHYLPPKVVTNFDLEKVMNTSDEWIRQRSGIVERHHVEPGVGSSDLAYEAAQRAIDDARIDKSEIDFIIAATLLPIIISLESPLSSKKSWDLLASVPST